MKRTAILNLAIATAIALSGLLVSIVLPQTAGYDIQVWSVSGGGGSAGRTYVVEDTIGQPIAERISGGTYVLETGFWDSDTALQPGPVYLPQLSHAPTPTPSPTRTPGPTPTRTPTPTSKCDSFEPNDSRTNPTGPLLAGQTYQAKFCAGDAEDNYFFTTTTGNQIQITITLPPALVNHTLLWVYDQDDLRQGQEVCKHGFISKSPLTVLCSIQNPGTYVLRLYPDSGAVFDNVNPYTFRVDFQ
jgi:hypothetical protein